MQDAATNTASPSVSALYGELSLPVLGSVEFDVPVQDSPEPTCIVGPNASGKSAFLSSMAYLAMGGVGLAFDSPVDRLAIAFEDGGKLLARRSPSQDDASDGLSPVADIQLVGPSGGRKGIMPFYASARALSSTEMAGRMATMAEDLRWRLACGVHAPVSASSVWTDLVASNGGIPISFIGTLRLGMPSPRYAEARSSSETRGTLPACRAHLASMLEQEGSSIHEVAGSAPASRRRDGQSPSSLSLFSELLDVVDRFFAAEQAFDFFTSSEPHCLLSAGQQHLIALLYGVLLASEPRSVILIDEPELSLHAAWQHPLLGELSSAAAIRGSRIVAATHSAGVLNDWWDQVVSPTTSAGPLHIREFDLGGSTDE